MEFGESPTSLVCSFALNGVEAGALEPGPREGWASHKKARYERCTFTLLGRPVGCPRSRDAPSLMGRRWMLSGSRSSWDRKTLRRFRETLACTESNNKLQLFLNTFLQKQTEANSQWFPLGAEGPTSSLISQVSAFPTPSGRLRRQKLNGSGLLFVFL